MSNSPQSSSQVEKQDQNNLGNTYPQEMIDFLESKGFEQEKVSAPVDALCITFAKTCRKSGSRYYTHLFPYGIGDFYTFSASNPVRENIIFKSFHISTVEQLEYIASISYQLRHILELVE